MNKLPILFPLVGTIIGVGFFALPYSVNQLPIWVSFPILISITIISFFTNLLYTRIIVNTHGEHQLPGYVQIYLGSKIKPITSTMTILGGLGTCLAYIIIIGSLFNLLLPTPINEKITGILLVVIFGLTIYKNRSFDDIEKYFTLVLLAVLFFFGVKLGLNYEALETIRELNTKTVGFSEVAIMIGVSLAAITGFSILPEMKQRLKQKNTLTALAVSSFLPIFLYILFIFAILGHSDIISENALDGVVGNVSNILILSGALTGILAIITSYVSFSRVIMDTLSQDFGVPKNIAFSSALYIPLILYLLGIDQLVLVIGTVGGIFTAFTHFIIYKIYKRKFGSNLFYETIAVVLIAIVIFEIIHLLLRFF